MATLILLENGKAYASSDEKKVIRCWKHNARNSKTPVTVLEDYVDENGLEKYSIIVPHYFARKSAVMLIPKYPVRITEEECEIAKAKIREAEKCFDRSEMKWPAGQ